MPPEREEDEFGDSFVPMPQGEVTIFWSSGHEMVWFYGDSFTALEEYQRALTLSRTQVDRLPKRPSTRRVREHHVVELTLNGHWRIDPVRCEEALIGKRAWISLDEQKAAFDGRITTVTMPSLFRRIAHIVEVERFEQLLPAVANLPFPFNSYHKTIVIIGDDPTDLEEQARLRLQSVCAAVMEAAAKHYDVAVVDRGQRSMVSQLLGDRVTYERVLLVGVACAATVALPDVYRQETPAGKSELESSHTAFFLVPGTRRTDEAAWLAKVASAFAGIDPSIALLIHGGDEAWQDVFAQLDEHRRVVALEGTGGIADLLSAAARGEHVDDHRVVQCIASGLIRTIPLDAVDEVKELVGVVTSLHPVSLR
jgi:hypothetical protein